MACLRKRRRKDGFVWVVDYTYEGRRFVQSTRTSDFGIAKRILHDIQGRIAQGRFNLKDLQKRHIRISDFFDQYFRYVSSYKKPHTIVNERNYTKKFTAFVGDISIQSIGTRMLDLWRADQLSKLSPVTFNIERRTLQAAFQLAVKWKYLEENPFKGVEKAKSEEKRLFMQAEELQKVFDLIEKDIITLRVRRHKAFLRKFRLLIIFLLNTGLRRDEALRLAPKDVDVVRHLIHIEHTKSKRMRTVPLNVVASQVLGEVGDGLFSTLNREHVSRKFAHYVEKAGMEGFKLHSLRHTFATNLVSAGVDIYAVSRLLGHSDIRTSLIYAKARVETLRDAVQRLEGTHPLGDNSVTQRGVSEKTAGKTGRVRRRLSCPKSDALSS